MVVVDKTEGLEIQRTNLIVGILKVFLDHSFKENKH